jgi:hypothetical protein
MINKKILLLVLIFSSLTGLYLSAQPHNKDDKKTIKVTVDPRIELISIIFRLAGNSEYNECKIPKYDKDIRKYFDKFKNHPAVKYAAELKQKHGISYNAPMSLAVYLADTNSLSTLVPLEPLPAKLDLRWNTNDAKEFLEKARQFVKDTDFETFFNEHKPLYEKACKEFQKMLDKDAHLEWLDEFFGSRPNAEFHIVIGMANGSGSYGADAVVKNEHHIYAIIGIWRTDLSGEPLFPESICGTVVHEFGHSYTNPIVEKHLSQLESAGKVLFPQVEEKMKKMAYGNWQVMMFESVVRAAEIQYYYQYKGKAPSERAVRYNIDKGFFWMKELNQVVSEYRTNRAKYPDFESFFPRIVEFFNEYAQKFEQSHKKDNKNAKTG